MVKIFVLLFFFSTTLLSQELVTKFYPVLDHQDEVFAWYKQPNSGGFYSKVDEPLLDPTVDIEYVYSEISTEPIVGNTKLKLLLKYSGNPIFSIAKFPDKTLNVRCSQTFFDGNEELYVSYTPALVNNVSKLVEEYIDNTIVFEEVGCPTSGTFSTMSFDLGVDYGLPPEANGAVVEFRWGGCNDESGCIVKISTVEVSWDDFRIVPIISE